jgi:hypothetical protein
MMPTPRRFDESGERLVIGIDGSVGYEEMVERTESFGPTADGVLEMNRRTGPAVASGKQIALDFPEMPLIVPHDFVLGTLANEMAADSKIRGRTQRYGMFRNNRLEA